MGAIHTAAEYAAATPINTPPFIDPLFPGAAAIIQPNSTRPQISAIEHQFNKTLRQWTEYKNLTNVGKNFIQDGIDGMYLKGKADRNVSLAYVTIREILEFLFQNYGNITQYDIEANDKKLKEKWDANNPIEILFNQIEDAQDFASTAGQPYTNNQLQTMAYNLIYTMGLFFDNCKAWNRLPALQKTMDNFKTTFQQAQRELRNQQRTAQQAGFQTNGIWCLPTTMNNHPLQETAEALANLATAMASDHQALQNLTNMVKDLSNQIKAKDQQIEDLIKAMNNTKTPVTSNRSNRWEKKDFGSYCHTHGYLVGPKHTSENCRLTPQQCQPTPPFTKIIDTDTSHHNLALGDGNPQQCIPYAANAPHVMIPNGDNITAKARYNLHLPNVSQVASEADVLLSFKHSLLSVGLCNDDCTAIFSKHKCTIYSKHNKPVIIGIQNHTTGLYKQQIPANNITNVNHANATIPTFNLWEHIKYLHQCAFSPTT